MAATTETTGPAPEARGIGLVPVLLLLTVVSGLIDAVSYLGLGHVFTANMTGNVVVLGFAMAGTPGFSVAHTATSLACFLVGAYAGGRVATWFKGRSRRTWARATLGVEAVLVGVAAAVAFAEPHADATTYALIGLTALAMGIRNATVRKLGVPSLTTTTVLTTTMTGLVSDDPHGEGRHFLRRAGAVVALLIGATAGGLLLRHQGLGLPLLIAAVTSAVLALLTSGQD
ncbi:YoaK family protein [Streptomyces brasiliensis]|uniref:Membrane protein n=1 Tax=Streptomyces brasiliensis TaxID=1954 RepID=A0A917KHW8_9ACTN|nr:YoaK family protein [Streptomyces brasiliensis]GGJ12024.1 membrane protein [Streptomyces brasiliensis]